MKLYGPISPTLTSTPATVFPVSPNVACQRPCTNGDTLRGPESHHSTPGLSVRGCRSVVSTHR